MTRKGLISRHPLGSYFVLTFAISWGALLIMIGHNGFPPTKESLFSQLPLAILAMLAGPSISGIVMTGLVEGKAGLRSLYLDCLNGLLMLAGTQWLFWLALSMIVVVIAFFLTSRHVPGIFALNNKLPTLLSGVFGGVIVGICEELGWTGFAVPRLRLHHNILTSGLILGVIWGAWHILSNDVWAIRTYSGALSPTLYSIITGVGFLIGQLPPFRILMVWVYDRTESLLVLMLMHASLTATTLILASLTISGALYGFLMAVSMWAIAATVVATNRRELTEH